MSNYPLASKIKSFPCRSDRFRFELLPDFKLKIPLKRFQVQGLMYIMAAEKCILADATGLGKSAQCIALIQLLDQLKRSGDGRWIIVAPPTVIYQWAGEFEKFSYITPYLGLVSRRERVSYYVGGGWQVYILSYQVLLRDWDLIQELGVKNWILDDAHYFRHHDTKTAQVVKMLTNKAERVILSTATPFQKNPLELHSLLEAIGLQNVFGSKKGFENYYCIMRKEKFWRDGRSHVFFKFDRPKNLGVLRKKFTPYYIRRGFGDVGEELPELIVRPLWLELSPQQVELQKMATNKIVRMWDAGEFKTVRNTGFHYLRKLCAGTKTLELEDDHSTKLDAISQFVRDKLGNEKVLIYSFYKATVRAIADRLRSMGRTDFEIISGDVSDKRERERIKDRFLNDPSLRILIGTDTIRVGLNLQSARYLLCVDLILNPQEIIQLIGRLRRLGSKVNTIVVYFLLTKGTLEERLYKRLKYESAVYDVVFGQKASVFPALSTAEWALVLGVPQGKINVEQG